MNTRTAAVALLLAFIPVAATSPTVFAQTAAPDDATTKAARARFQEGVAFFDKGQYENARAAFLQAYALRKHPAVLINLAQSSLRAGHTLEAAKFFVQYIHESSSLTDAQRGDAEKGLAEARTKLGRIEVGAPAGAEISVDGDKVGTAPLAEPVDVEPGTHKVSSRSPDGNADTKSVTAVAGQQVSAHFGPGGQTAVTPPTPPPTEPPPTEPPPTEPPPTEPPSKETEHANPPPQKKAEGGWGIWSSGRLATYVPTIIGGVVGAAGFGTAIVLAISKGSAQNSATSVANEIMANGGTQGTCYNTPTSSRFYQACNTLASNNNNVNTDALVANIGLAVGIVGTVGALGWLLLGPRRAEESSPAASPPPPPTTSVIPFVGPHVGGIGLTSTF